MFQLVRSHSSCQVDRKPPAQPLAPGAERDGTVTGEQWEVQQAWETQASFLAAQAKAQSELRSMIKQYDELLHKNWGQASEEQKARIEQMKANAERLRKGNGSEDDGEGVEIINDAEKEAGKDL